jgi:CheY-like chemotaxis protein
VSRLAENEPNELSPHAGTLAGSEAVRPRVLLVDDEDHLLRVWTRQLQGARIEIWTACSGREAVDALAREKGDFDAVVCDLHMYDGIELYRFIEAEHSGLQHRVVFTTDDALSPRESDFLRMTGNPVLEKPCEVEALLELVGDWAARRQGRASSPASCIEVLRRHAKGA